MNLGDGHPQTEFNRLFAKCVKGLEGRDFREKIETLRRESGPDALKFDTLKRYAVDKVPGLADGPRIVDVLSRLLELTPVARAAFHEAWRSSLLKKNKKSVAGRSDERDHSLEYLPDLYSPFSGAPNCFVDDFIMRALRFADMSITAVTKLPKRIGDRINIVKKGKAALVVNLITARRMKKLKFFAMPIRVSLNGVLLRNTKQEAIEAARRSLAGLETSTITDREKFRLLTIEGEVADAHTERIAVAKRWDNAPHSRHASLDVGSIADALRRKRKGVPVVLCCDEITALGVVEKLGGMGRLLYPLSTDMSVLGSEYRRHLPAHHLGVGYARPQGTQAEVLRATEESSLYEDVIKSYLTLEVETTAVSYQKLYDSVVDHVRRCLHRNPKTWVLGVRPVELPAEVSRTWYHESLVDQNARAFARRCLSLSLRSSDSYPADDPWTPILRRTRERITQVEARRRNAVRSALVSAIGLVVGLPGNTYEISRVDYELALSRRWRELAFVLERNVEVRLRRPKEFFRDLTRKSLEQCVSAFQKELEGEAWVSDVPVVRRASVAECAVVESQCDQAMLVIANNSPDHVRYFRRRRSQKGLLRFVVTSLGETIGIAWVRRAGKTLELIDIYVVPHRRKTQVAHFLMTSLIDHADERRLKKLTIQRASVPESDHLNAWFSELGFTGAPSDSALTYTLYPYKRPGKSRSTLRRQANRARR